MGCCFTTFCRTTSTPKVEVFPSGYTDISLIHNSNSRKVFRCNHRGTDLCCKIISLKSRSSQTELNILKYLALKKLPGPVLSHSARTENNLQIFYHHIQGCDLFEYFKTHGKLKENLCKNVALRLLNTLAIYHRHRIWHLDLKLENILCLNGSILDLVIIDFGQGKLVPSGCTINSCKNQGTLGYAAPELSNRLCCENSDIWSFGVLIYILLIGEYPLPSDEALTRKVLLKYKKKYWPKKFIGISPLCVDFFNRIFKFSPIERASIKELLKHAWLKSQ